MYTFPEKLRECVLSVLKEAPEKTDFLWAWEILMLNFSIAAKSIQFVGNKYRASDILKKKETKRVTWYIVVKNNNKEKIANTLKCSWK